MAGLKTDLILTDITVMGQGYCVIGLEEISPDNYRSIRPLPPWGFAWRDPFPFRRGDRVSATLRPVEVKAPHLEDKQSDGLTGMHERLVETDLIHKLKQAEVAESLERLFDCPVQCGTRAGGALWVDPSSARRSICGCEYENLRFRLYPEPEGYALRAEMAIRSNQRVPSIPIVDRTWRKFTDALLRQVSRAEPLPLVERFLNRTILPKLVISLHRFARIGLPRPRADYQCWLMLDSLFPQPQKEWLDLL